MKSMNCILKLHEYLKEKCSAYKEKYEENMISRFVAETLIRFDQFNGFLIGHHQAE